jgi:hypothetical protein
MRFITVIFTVIVILAACTEPSPLYGTWADNKGNTFSFFDDNTFNAKVKMADDTRQDYSGNYSLLLNSLTLTCTEPEGIELRVVTEWDIRGNILYLDWVTPEDGPMALTLFKVSN